jgi:hypothetical protein
MRMTVNSRSKQQNRLNCFVDNGVEAHNLDMLMTIDRRELRGHTLFVASRCQTGEKKSLTKPSYQLLDGCGIMVAMLAFVNQEHFFAESTQRNW